MIKITKIIYQIITVVLIIVGVVGIEPTDAFGIKIQRAATTPHPNWTYNETPKPIPINCSLLTNVVSKDIRINLYTTLKFNPPQKYVFGLVVHIPTLGVIIYANLLV